MNHPPIYTLPFAEVCAMASRGENILSVQGYPLCTRDRKFDEKYAYYIWSADVDNAIYAGKLDPADNPKGTSAPENIKPMKDSRPVNAKGKTFSWSFSALNDFDGALGCPLKYAHNRFYCTTQTVESEAMAWGNRVHKAAEIFVGTGEVQDPEGFKPVEKYARLFLSMKEKGAEVLPEMEIVLDQNMVPITGSKAWFAKTAWFRCKIDVPIIQGTKASVFDYKTGAKIKEDYEQLHLCLASLGLIRKELEEFKGKLIWTQHQQTSGCPDLDRAGVNKVWENVLPRVKRMEDAWKADNFPARKNPLCGKYCEVLSCAHNGRR